MNPTSVEDAPARLFPSMGALISNFVIAASMVPLGLFVFSLMGRYFFFAELVCNFRLQVMLMLVPFAIFAIGARRWWLSGLIVVALGWSTVGIVSVYLPGFQPPPGEQKLKVMSYNVLGDNENSDQIVEQIRNVDPDFISVLEYSGHWHQAFECFDERYPFQIRLPRWHGFGVAMFSKYPLSDTQVLQLTKENTDNPCVVTNVSFGEQTIRMAALHVLSPTDRYRMDLRNQQFREVAEAMGSDDIPTVVMGDFNCAPWSPFLSDFVDQTGYRDSRRGFGYQATFPSMSWIFQIPIDHAFVSREVHVHSRVVGERSDSDHLPIIFEISTAK